MRCGRPCIRLLPLLFLAVSPGCARSGVAPGARAIPAGVPTVTVTVTVAQSGLAPEVIRVPAGSRVVVEFRSPVVEHGFATGDSRIAGVSVEDHRPAVAILAGGTATATLYADRPGTFAVRCSRHGGLGHSWTKGQLVVEPLPGGVRVPTGAGRDGEAPAAAAPRTSAAGGQPDAGEVQAPLHGGQSSEGRQGPPGW